MPPGPRSIRIPWLAFALCLLLTAAAAGLVGYAEHQAERARVANAVIAARDRIRERMSSYISVLRGSAGLLSRPQPVTAEEFRSFIDRLKLREHYPGTQGVGYTARFGAVDVAEATAMAHARGWTDLRVWPDTPRDEVHAIVLLEPIDLRNRAALGYDMGTEQTRREAMDRARDLGDVALSGKLTLVQEIEEEKQPGFILYSPVYTGGAVPPTLAERRARLAGYVYAPLRAGDLFEGIFGDERPTVAFALYDGDVVDEHSLLHAFGRRIEADDEVMRERLDLAGHVWTACFVRASAASRSLSLTLLVAGLGATLSVVVLVMTRARERARAREVRATAEALANQQMLRFTDLFIGILGHDLRTPLSAIVLTCELLLRQAGEAGPAVDALRRIRSSAERMARMIEQLLDLTRVRLGGGIRITPRPGELGALVRDVVDEVVSAAPDAPIEVDASGDLAGTWDPDRLAQVFSNLVDNAVRHRLTGPVRVTLDGTAPDRVVATVHNAGAIPPSLLPVVFEPFRARGGAPDSSPSGLGLGLYITRALVEAHGGAVTVHSTEAAGTTFTVALPRRVGQRGHAGPPGPASSHARKDMSK